MSISVLDLFKIGIGPSSSHTVGPMRAAHDFAAALAGQGLLGSVQRIEVKLYGSLSATGIGHGTDRAAIAGLMGARPDEVDPDFVIEAVDLVRLDEALPLAGTHSVPFVWNRDMRLLPVSLPYHPNAMRLIAHGEAGVVYENTYYSIGGGFVVDEAQVQSGLSAEAELALPHPFDSGAALLAQCRRHGLSISELMLANEDCMAQRGGDACRAAAYLGSDARLRRARHHPGRRAAGRPERASPRAGPAPQAQRACCWPQPDQRYHGGTRLGEPVCAGGQ